MTLVKPAGASGSSPRRRAEQERAQAIDQAASQLGDMVSGILAERRRDEERREARAAAAAERKQQYRLKARAAYLAAPERPRCTAADARESLTLDQPTAGMLSLNGCRLADSTSATLYDLVLDQPRAVTVTLDVSAFYGVVRLEQGDRVIANGSQYEPIEQKLPAGRYRVVVTSESLGETGTYSVMAHRSVLSKIPGISYSFFAGYTPTPFSGESAQEEGGLRLGLGLGNYVMLIVQGGTSDNGDGVDQTFVQYGARGYFRNQYTAWRPFVQAVTGTHKYDVWKSIGIDHYQGSGTSFGGGVEWFGARRLGMEAALYQSTGSMSMPGSSSSVSLGGMHVHLGFTFHQ